MFIIIISSSSSITILLHSQLLNNTYIYSVLDKKKNKIEYKRSKTGFLI